jgi:hypothetical protein
MPGTTCDCPVTISDRGAVGLRFSRKEDGEPTLVVLDVAIIEADGPVAVDRPVTSATTC